MELNISSPLDSRTECEKTRELLCIICALQKPFYEETGYRFTKVRKPVVLVIGVHLGLSTVLQISTTYDLRQQMVLNLRMP